jgi:hypothetical protein
LCTQLNAMLYIACIHMYYLPMYICMYLQMYIHMYRC